MSAQTETFIPLDQANTERVQTRIDLPFGLSEQVGINTSRIESLLQISGFRYALIKGIHDEPISSSSPLIVGVDKNGAALAGKVNTSPVPTQTSGFKDQANPINFPKQARWSNLAVKINIPEIQQQILNEAGSVKDPHPWAKKINSSLKQGIVKAGKNNLLKDFNHYDMKFYPGSYALYFFLSLAMGSDPAITLHNFALLGTVASILQPAFYGAEKTGQGRRFSLFFGPEIDRALLLGIMGNLRQLAKPMASSKLASK